MINMSRGVTFGTQLSDTIGALYTCPAGTKAMIKRISFYNTNTTNEAIDIRLLQAGGTVGDSNIFKKSTVSSEGTLTIVDFEGHVLGPGDSIQGVAVTASKVNVFISVLEQT